MRAIRVRSALLIEANPRPELELELLEEEPELVEELPDLPLELEEPLPEFEPPLPEFPDLPLTELFEPRLETLSRTGFLN